MRRSTELTIWGAVVVTSLGLHAVAFGGLGRRGDGGRVKGRSPALVEMSVQEPSKRVPPLPARQAEQPAPRRALARPLRVRAAAAPTTTPPAAESPADFTGVTMTNEGPGAGWSTVTGNGEAMHGPLGRPGARVTRRVVEGDGAADVAQAGPPVLAAADLSRVPVAPDLAPALARAYPAEARAKGLTGQAVVHARVLPDGHVAQLKLVSASGPGFGAACLTTLRASIWSAPVDRQSRPASTFVNYTCRFEVQ